MMFEKLKLSSFLELLPSKFIVWLEKNPQRIGYIHIPAFGFTPVYVAYFALNWGHMVESYFLTYQTIISFVLLLVPLFAQTLKVAFEKRATTIKSLERISFLLRSVIAAKPTDGWQNWDLKRWENNFQAVSKGIESLLQLTMANKYGRDRHSVERDFNIACNLMVLVNKSFDVQKIEHILSQIGENNSYDLYNDLDQDQSLDGYFLIVGISEKSQKRNLKPCYIRIYDDESHCLPGAPLLFHKALKKSDEPKLLNNIQEIKDVKDFDGFYPNVSKEAKERFLNIFTDKNSPRSFISIPLYWNKQLVGALNVESKREKFLSDDVTKDMIDSTLAVLTPILGAFVYVFNFNFIQKTTETVVQDEPKI